ncbi:MAG: hypothetical protein JW951_02745 [Lentisphaerae bacterium]|nr:hypothetical protein [Lentisphaerota bacterium]
MPTQGPCFDAPLQILVITPKGAFPELNADGVLKTLVASADTVLAAPDDGPLNPARADLVLATGLCGSNPFAAELGAAGVPVMPVTPYGGFHPYVAEFCRAVTRAGGTVLPADTPEEAQAALAAVRARKALRETRLLTVLAPDNVFVAEQTATFAAGFTGRTGVAMDIRATDEMAERADGVSDPAADAELARWEAEILDGPGEMDRAHMLRVARLYLAMRAMLEETGAAGISVADIAGFLLRDEPRVMPNAAYGPLVRDGFLAAEEGDAGVLASELLLYAGTGAHPTMSNVYFAYRDRLSALDDAKDYTHEMELEDCRQCFADNHITLAHFSTSGVLPPGMMTEARYTVREAVPSWPGQSMIAATPRLGPVVLARLDADGNALHWVPGEADALGTGDRYGWYRGRWFVRLPDAKAFARACLHHHYAVGPRPPDLTRLDTLAHTLLGFERV